MVKKHFIIAVFSILISSIYVKASQYNLIDFSSFKGLSNKSITCFYQDKKGFIWVGTTNGLNRFDGYQFKSFTYNPNDSLSLDGNIIYTILEISNEKILLSTSGGFFIFNPKDESFRKTKINGMNNFYMVNFGLDGQGNLWGLQDLKTLIKIDTSTYTIKQTIHLDSLMPDKNAGINFALTYYDNKLWLGGSLGIIAFDIKSRKATLITSDIDPMFMQMSGFRQGWKKNSLLAVDGIRGLYEINTKTLGCTHFKLSDFKKIRPETTRIIDATFDKNGEIWISASNGFFKISKPGKISFISNISTPTNEFEPLEANNLFTDKNGNLWIGTIHEGLYALQIKNSSFNRIKISNKAQRRIAVNSIVANGNNIFFSTNGGVFCINKSQNPVESKPIAVFDSASHAIAFDNNKLLVFTDEIVYSYNFKNRATVKAQMYVKYMHYGIYDSRGIIWGAHWGWGLEGYNCKTGKRYKIDVVPYDLQKNIISSLYEDIDGSLWLATYGSGLVHVINPDSEHPKLICYSHKKDSNSISNNFILSIHDDGKGHVWIGTNGGGLNKFDKKSGLFETFTLKDGLKSDFVNAIQSDKAGNIWFASSCISKYDIKSKSFSHFDNADGIVSKYFTGAAFRDESGNIYFGDDEGVVVFDPMNIKIQKESRIPELTGIRFFGQSLNTRQNIGSDIPIPISFSYTSTINLPYYLNSFTIEFSSLQIPENINTTYSCKMEGIDDRWIPLMPGEHSVTYSALEPGNYIFKVKAISSSGVSSQIKTLKIIIYPPWWKTIAFRVLLIMLAISIITIILYSKINKIKRLNRILEEMVNNRTNELKQANDTLLDQAEELETQAISLHDQNKYLREQSLIIELKNTQLNDAIDSQEKLIGIIAHDFKNPLSAIYGLSTLLRDNLSQLSTSELEKYSEIIANASDSLRNQMISVIDWVQNRNESLIAKSIEINIETLLKDSVSLLKINANNKQINITFQFDYQTNCFVDPQMISIVFRNLLNNAIKFTPRFGSILLMVQELETTIDISFIDTGIGIEDERIKLLFETTPQYTNTYGTEQEKGMGLGLQLCRSLILKNKGTLTISSQKGKGTNVTVSLPKGLTDAAIKQMDIETDEDSVRISKSMEGNYSILVIDDNIEILETISETLSPNYKVIKATTGNEGLFLAMNTLPDIIISDIVLPGINGLDLCNMLKNQVVTSHIPILLITSQKKEQLEEIGYNSGAADFIEKPFNPYMLKQKINSLIEIKIKLETQIKQQMTQGNNHQIPVDYNSKIINKVIKYIYDNISEETMDTSTIADKIGVSRSQLWRIFKNTTGKSLGDYIREIRMQKAIEMLKTGKFKISDIAIEIGYSNPRYFIRTFSKEFGISPSDYTKKHNT